MLVEPLTVAGREDAYMGFRRGASSASCAAVLTILIVAAIVPGMQVNAVYHDYMTLPLSGEKVFECQTTADALWWTANGDGVLIMGDPTIQQGSVGRLESSDTVILQLNLTVQATEDNNNTVFRCMDPDTVVYCVNMTVQGFLQAPVELTATPLDTSSVKLQWTPPFTLNITDEHPDITHYSIYITDIGTNEVTQVNVTGTEYIFTGDKCKDVTYKFSITAWNMVGEGETGKFPGEYDLKASEPVSVEVTEISVSHTEEEAVAACNFTISTTCHGRPLPESCTVEVSSSTGNSKQLVHTLYGESNHMIEIDELSLDNTYELGTTCDGSESTFTFTTYDTQSASVAAISTLGEVDIECTFAQGSSAHGCVVVLSDSLSCELELYREKGDSKAAGQITLPRGTYHAKVYDMKQDGKSSQPVFTMDSFTVESSSTSVCNSGKNVKQYDNESFEDESGSGSTTMELIIIAVVAIGGGLAVITTPTVVVVVVVCRKRAHRKNHSTDAAFIIPTVKQNSYEATQTKPQTASSDLESSGTSGSTVESHLSSDFTIPLEPPEGTPGLLYASLQVQPPRGQAVQKEDDVAYTQVHLPNVHEP